MVFKAEVTGAQKVNCRVVEVWQQREFKREWGK